MNTLKLYIAVLDEVPDHMVPVLVAHAMLGAHIHWQRSHWENYSELSESTCMYEKWVNNSFKKVVLRVNQKEFNKIKALDDVYLGHENTTLEGVPSCAIVCPRHDIPNVLKFAKMWKPKPIVLHSPHFTGTNNPIDFPK